MCDARNQPVDHDEIDTLTHWRGHRVDFRVVADAETERRSNWTV